MEKGMGNPLQYSCLENYMDGEDWMAIAHGIPKSWVLLNNCHFTSLSVSSVIQSYPTLCDPMDCSPSGFPVHQQLPEFTQTHVHQVCDPIQPSHPLSSPSPPAFNLPSIRVFSNESQFTTRWPKYWSFIFSISLPMSIQE